MLTTRQLTACFAGLVAGILGLTNLAGFALYLGTALATGLTVAAAKCGGNLARFSVQAHAASGPLGAAHVSAWRAWTELMGLGQENLLGFLLFWIGGYALVHGESGRSDGGAARRGAQLTRSVRLSCAGCTRWERGRRARRPGERRKETTMYHYLRAARAASALCDGP